MYKKLEQFDLWVISLFRKYGDEFARFALFLIFFWFGILKVPGLSPAGPLVTELLDATFLGFMEPHVFLAFFGIFEMFVGVILLVPRLERISFAFLAFHLVTTVMPLFMLPEVTWSAPFVPTLIGQYIIKNVALFAVSMLLFARLVPMTKTHSILGKDEE